MPKFGKLLGVLLLFAIGVLLLYKNSQTPLETIFVILAILLLIVGIYLVIRGLNYSSNLIEVPKKEIANTVGIKVKSANVGNSRGNRMPKKNNNLASTSNLKPSSLNLNSKRNNNNNKNRNINGNGMNNRNRGNKGNIGSSNNEVMVNNSKIKLNGSNGLNNNISSLNKDNSNGGSVNSSCNNYNSLNKHRLVKPKEEKPKSKIDILKNSFSSSMDDEVKKFIFQPNYQKPNLVTRKPKKKEVPSHSLEDLLSAESSNKNPKKSETENNIFDNISKYTSNRKKSDKFKKTNDLDEFNLIKPKIKEFSVDTDNSDDGDNDVIVINNNNDNNNVNINDNISEYINKYGYDNEYNETNVNIGTTNTTDPISNNSIHSNLISVNDNTNNYSGPKLNKNPEGSNMGDSNYNIGRNNEDINIAENDLDSNINNNEAVNVNNNEYDNGNYNDNIDKEFYVVCENKILSSNESVEKLILMAKNEIILEIPSLKGLSPDILANLSNASRIIIGQFDIKDMSYALLLSSLIEQNTEIRTLDFVDSINMIVDDNYGLIISGVKDSFDRNESCMGVGAVYNDSESISSIRDMFNKSWEIATEIKI